MIRLCYISSSVGRPETDGLVKLLKQCHANNGYRNITGLLLYNGKGTFLQALEGESNVVDSLFAHIRKDQRHERVTCISRRPIESRNFPTWKMGFRNLANQSALSLEGYSDFLEADGGGVFWTQNNSVADALLSHFKVSTEELVF